MNFKNYNLSIKDRPYLIGLSLFSIILVSYYILFTLKLGIFCQDVYVYLINSLAFTGVELRYEGYIYLAPVISFLTSILFRLGIENELAIYIVTGSFAVIGNIGFYLLLKTRFNEYLSFTGAMIYSCLSLTVLWLANGTLDVPAIAVTIWIVFFTILAVEKDSKYYPVVFTLFLIGFLVRFTVGFILPTIFIYIIYKTRLKFDKRTKKLIIGSIIGCIALVLLAIGILYMVHPRNLYFLEIINNAFHGSRGSESDSAYTLDTWFYLKHFLQFISSNKLTFNEYIPILESPTPLAYAVAIIVAIGAILSLDNLKKIKIKNKKLAIATITLAIFTALSFNSIMGIASVSLTLVVILMAYEVLKDSGYEHLDVNFLFLAWFLVYFLYFTYFNTKVDRYILTAMPAFIYFVIYSIDKIEMKINIKKIIPLVLIVFFVVNAFSLSVNVDNHINFKGYEEITDILKEMDPDYKSKGISTHNQRPCVWYLKKPVYSLLVSRQSALDQTNVTYYISPTELTNVTNYTVMAEKNGIYIYKHI